MNNTLSMYFQKKNGEPVAIAKSCYIKPKKTPAKKITGSLLKQLPLWMQNGRKITVKDLDDLPVDFLGKRIMSSCFKCKKYTLLHTRSFLCVFCMDEWMKQLNEQKAQNEAEEMNNRRTARLNEQRKNYEASIARGEDGDSDDEEDLQYIK